MMRAILAQQTFAMSDFAAEKDEVWAQPSNQFRLTGIRMPESYWRI
jgi:hypothetical protein